MMPKIHLVTSLTASEKAVKKLLCVEQPVVGVCCHGTSVRKNESLTSVTVGTTDGDVYVFDVRTCPNIVLDGGLIRLFQSVELVKVFHDCSRDTVFLNRYSVKIRNYFDTQVAYSVYLEQNSLPPRKISLSNLCEKYRVARYTPSKEERHAMVNDVNYWGKRPMSKTMLHACAADVSPLVPTLYHTLARQLDSDMWKWFDCMSEENRISKVEEEKIKSLRSSRRDSAYSKISFQYPVVKFSEERKHLVVNTVPEAQEMY